MQNRQADNCRLRQQHWNVHPLLQAALPKSPHHWVRTGPPYTFEILSENVSRNALTAVELHREHDRSITLYRPDVENGSSLRMNTINLRLGNSHSITAPAKRLSTSLPPHEVDLLKMDIEGAEHAVIRELACANSMRRIRRIHLEYHYHLDRDQDQLASIAPYRGKRFRISAARSRPLWPSKRVFQDMLIYCYRKAPQG
jgi:FkbM family methyltransferase